MMYKTLSHKSVRFDLMEAKAYYRKINPFLAKRFFDEFRVSKNFISEFPYANDIIYGENIRLQLLPKFPYHIHYIIDEKKKAIIVLAVIFGKKGDIDFSQRL